MLKMRSTDQIGKVAEWIDGATVHRSTDFEEGEGATAGFAWSLYDLNLKLLTKLIPIVSRDNPTILRKDVKALKQSLGDLFLWGDGFRDGGLESILEESDDLKETVVSSLVGIGALLISKIAVRVKSISTGEGIEDLVRELGILLEKARILRENDIDSEGVSDGDNTDLEDHEDRKKLSSSLNSLSTYTTCLMDLLPSMEDTFNFTGQARDEDDSSSPLDFHVSGPARTYILNIFDRFSKANPELVERLGEANWQRHITLRNGITKKAESAHVVIEVAPKSVFVPVSLFQDSGLGTSLPTHTSYAGTSASHTSFVSSQADEEGRGLRVPPTPKAVSKGIPFSCEICGQTLSQIKNRIDWKRHVFADLKPYICTFSDCKDALRTFPTRKMWETHEFDHHRSDTVLCCSVCPSSFQTEEEIETHLRAGHETLSEKGGNARGILFGFYEQRKPHEAKSLSCPLCLCIPGKSRRNFAKHVGKHLESIALAALPRENGSGSESDSEHESATTTPVEGIAKKNGNDSTSATTKTYHCPHCGYKPRSDEDWRLSNLKRHILTEHPHEKKKKIHYEIGIRREKSLTHKSSRDSGVRSTSASDRASLGTTDQLEDEPKVTQAVLPSIDIASSTITAAQLPTTSVSSSEWELLLSSLDGSQTNLYDAIYGGPPKSQDEIPIELRCAGCSRLALNAYWLPCCEQAICDSCQLTVPSVCPVCEHSPIRSTDCKPHKSMRTTITVFLRTEEKKRESMRMKENTPTEVEPRPASIPPSADHIPAPPRKKSVSTVGHSKGMNTAPGARDLKSNDEPIMARHRKTRVLNLGSNQKTETKGSWTATTNKSKILPQNKREHSPSPKLDATASSWMENDLYPELYRPDGTLLAKTNDIAQLPIVRPLILRPNRTLNYLHNPSHGLRNYKSALIYQRGTLQSAPCSGCVGLDPWGPFQHCVALSTAFQGSCTNCSYNGNETRCSLRCEENVSGRPVNPHSRNREAALRRALTVAASDMPSSPSTSPEGNVKNQLTDEETEGRQLLYKEKLRMDAIAAQATRNTDAIW